MPTAKRRQSGSAATNSAVPKMKMSVLFRARLPRRAGRAVARRRACGCLRAAGRAAVRGRGRAAARWAIHSPDLGQSDKGDRRREERRADDGGVPRKLGGVLRAAMLLAPHRGERFLYGRIFALRRIEILRIAALLGRALQHPEQIAERALRRHLADLGLDALAAVAAVEHVDQGAGLVGDELAERRHARRPKRRLEMGEEAQGAEASLP